MNDACVVLCTAPDSAVAESIADRLVTEKLAACVSVLPGLVSIYSWKGSRCRDTECLLVIKTTAAAYPALEQTIRQIHPYEVPEILRLPVVGGWSAYLDWINRSVAAPAGDTEFPSG